MKAYSVSSTRWLILGGCATLVAAGVICWFMAARSTTDVPAHTGPQMLVPLLPEPVTDNPSAGLRKELREILGFIPGTGPSRRLELLRTCGNDLNQTECDALLAALAQRRDPKTNAGWHSEYIHLISLVLQHHPANSERFARVLAAVIADETRDEVVRDYAMQHLRQVWSQAAANPNLRARILETFRQIMERDPVLGASAVLSLHMLGFHPTAAGETAMPAVASADLEPLVRQALGAPAAPKHLRLRMSCLRVASERGMVSVLPDIRRIIEDSAGEHALARMAAIAALGRLGEPTDRALLQSLTTFRDPRITGAVRHALDTLR